MALPIFHNFSPSTPWSVTGETKTIASDGTIFLDYTPQNASLSIEGFTSTNDGGNQAAGEFYYDYAVSSNYKAATQIVYFNTSKAGTTVTVSYTAVGQVIKADQMNEIKSHMENTEIHVPAIASTTAYLKTVNGADPTWATSIPWGDISEKPNFADPSWKSPVADIASLPLSGNTLGDLRLVFNDGDSGAIYECIATTGIVGLQWSKISDFSFATPPWSAITGKPTTLAGYGITDAVNTTGSQSIIGIKTFINNPVIQNNAPILQFIESDTSNKNWYIVADGGTFSIRENNTSTQRLCIEEGILKTTTGGYKFWHEGNDGAGSGLDADLLDGMSSAVSNTASTIVARDASGQVGLGRLELGNTSGNDTPFIDFHTTGSTTDYDVRITAGGGTVGTNSLGYLQMQLSYLALSANSGTSSSIRLNSDLSSYIYFNKNNNYRWLIGANPIAESGGNSGSNFMVNRYADDGTLIGAPLQISRSSGQVIIGDSTEQYPVHLYIRDSAHATSKRASLQLGSNWMIMQDSSGTGTKDFGIYSVAASQSPLYITADARQVKVSNNRDSEMQFIINAAAGQYNYTSLNKADKIRWHYGCDATTESGSNSGSNFYLSSYADDGSTWLRNILVINRTGEVTFTGGQTFTTDASTLSLTGGNLLIKSKYSIQYNSSADSLDFVYQG